MDKNNDGNILMSHLYSIATEREVLNTLLEGTRSLDKVREDYFYGTENKLIFHALYILKNEGKEPSIATIFNYIQEYKQEHRKASIVDGNYEAVMMEILGVNTGSADAAFDNNVAELANLYKRRKLLNLSYKLSNSALSLAVDIDSILEDLNKDEEDIISTSSNKYLDWIDIPSEKDIRQSLATESTGIKTQYAFERKNKEQQQLIIPSGAITLVCGQTSHGKSRFLQNLAIDTALDKEEGTVLYFTFEEDKKAVYKELLNIYADQDLAKNNLRTIGSFYKNEFSYFSKDTSIGKFQAKEREFMHIIQSGKLHIIEEDVDSTELILGIRTIARKQKIKAVFIDYAQLLNKAGNKQPRNEELKAIGTDLLKLAKNLSIPVIMAAQLNREAKSPVEMHNQNIADAADMERVAAVVIMLWNSSFKPLNKADISNANKVMEDKGITLGEPGKIYAVCTKYRGAERGNDVALEFNGNTGKIKHNYIQQEVQDNNNDSFF